MPPRAKGQPETELYSKSRASIKLSELLGTGAWVELHLQSEHSPHKHKVRILPLPCSYERFGMVYDIMLVHPERTSGDFRDIVLPDEISEGQRIHYKALNDLWKIDVDKIYVLPYGKGQH